MLHDPGTTRLLSAASGWEIALEYRLGTLPLPEHPSTYVPERMSRSATVGLPVDLDHVLRVADLPDHHGDPFDRLLVAQAQALDVAIVTLDYQITAYDVRTVRA